MRSLGVLVAVGLLSAGVTACGGAGKGTGSTSHLSSNAATIGAAASSPAAGAASDSSSTPPTSPTSTSATSPTSTTATQGSPEGLGLDAPAAPEDHAHFGFYGHPAGTTDRRAIIALVKRYYAAAAAGDGKGACAMLVPSLLKSIPVEYGQLGASYLRGAKTCAAVLLRLFESRHRELSVPVAVIGVFVKGPYDAYAAVVSSKMPTSIITLNHEHGAWMITRPLGSTVEAAFLPRNKRSVAKQRPGRASRTRPFVGNKGDQPAGCQPLPCFLIFFSCSRPGRTRYK
jgi:hypothetical protein